MKADLTFRPNRPTGFTLIELLVVVSIIALVATLGAYGVMRARRSMQMASAQTMLKGIQAGLETFRNDTGDYPTSYGPSPICRTPDTPADRWTGAHWLAQAMLGLADEDANNRDNADLAPGPGFRLIARGRVFGPYIDVEHARTRMIDGVPVLLDTYDHPILYYRFDAAAGQYRADDNNLDNPGDGDDILGPPDVNVYARRGGSDFLRRDYLICSPGPDGLWFCPGESGGTWGSDDDDFNNLE
ncbi:MAG: prepilin-type N-terminal cleavage/methylation domain-containing protein [Planctomycetes bacterium]|nr:prepilin-type N-terminal cleavage/methylation domain-containing protein [Planctomycetota bacterium]